MVPDGYTLGWKRPCLNLPGDGQPTRALSLRAQMPELTLRRLGRVLFLSADTTLCLYTPSGNAIVTMYMPFSQLVCRQLLPLAQHMHDRDTHSRLAGDSDLPQHDVERAVLLLRWACVEALFVSMDRGVHRECTASAGSRVSHSRYLDSAQPSSHSQRGGPCATACAPRSNEPSRVNSETSDSRSLNNRTHHVVSRQEWKISVERDRNRDGREREMKRRCKVVFQAEMTRPFALGGG
jgi:hypothetical protein